MKTEHYGILAMTSGRDGHESIHSVSQFYIRRLASTGHKGGMMTPARTSVHCFFFLQKGKVEINVADRRIVIDANSCLIIPMGQVFSVISFSDDAEGYMGGFHDNFLIPSRPLSFIYSWMSKPIPLVGKQRVYIENIFDRIFDEWNGGKDMQIIRAYLQTFITELNKCHSDIAHGFSAAEVITGNFLKMLSESERCGIETYAKRLNITPGHLTKCVRQITGKTPIKCVEEAIMTDAKMMLFQTDLHIGEIAEKLGIEDVSYFSRKFKASEGMTPNQFRQLIKKS